jgi:IS4 transposase
MDRGYLDFERLYRLHLSRAFFITRAKKNTACRRAYSRQIDKTTGLRCDQTVSFTGYYSKKEYPEHVRRIKFFDKDTGNTYVFLTNNFELDALLITKLYKERWKIELFFKWIKQHLRIKTFYGTSYNAVCCQIWIAVCSYLLVAIVKKRLRLEHSLYTLLQIFSLTLFEKVPINELFTKNDYNLTSPVGDKQLKLFDL